jgi:hypothetical protein
VVVFAIQVANLSSIDGASALPSIERIRLNMQFLQQFKGERHKEVGAGHARYNVALQVPHPHQALDQHRI